MIRSSILLYSGCFNKLGTVYLIKELFLELSVPAVLLSFSYTAQVSTHLLQISFPLKVIAVEPDDWVFNEKANFFLGAQVREVQRKWKFIGGAVALESKGVSH